MAIKMSYIWYYMIFLSDNDTVRFWGYINFYINNSPYGFFTIYFIIFFVVTFLTISITNLIKFNKYFSFLIGCILSAFIFFNVIAKQSTDITNYSVENARLLLETQKEKFDGFEEWKEKNIK